MFPVVFIVAKAETCSCVSFALYITRKGRRVGRPKGGPVWGSTFRIVPPVNGHLWWGENYSNINDPACPKAEASEMVQAGSFLFWFYICIFVCTLICICAVTCTRTLIQFLWRKTIAKPFLCRCLATWRPIIFKWFCLLEKGKLPKSTLCLGQWKFNINGRDKVDECWAYKKGKWFLVGM